MTKLDGGQVHRHDHRLHSPLDPSGQLLDGGSNHPLTNWQDQATVFSDGNELGGGHLAQLGMVPAQKRLDPHNVSGRQRYLRLKAQRQLVVQERAAQRIA